MVYLYYYYAFIFMLDIENSGLTHIPTTLSFVAYRILLAVAVGRSAKVRETHAGTVWAFCTLLLGPLAAVPYALVTRYPRGERKYRGWVCALLAVLIFIIGAIYTFAASS